MQTHSDEHRRSRWTQTYADKCRRTQTNARQTASSVWADATSRCIQTLDVCSRTFGTYYSLTCQPCDRYLDYFQYLKTHIGFVAIISGKLCIPKSLTRIVNIYNSSITPIAASGLFGDCCRCCVSKEHSIPVVKCFQCESTSLWVCSLQNTLGPVHGLGRSLR